MTGIFQDPTARALRVALDGLSLRQQVVANNVANADTPNFTASEVSFESALQQALSRGERPRLRLMQTNSYHIARGADSPRVGPAVDFQRDASFRNDGNNVNIDREMALLAETGITYGALSQLTAARLSHLRTAINEGRR